MRVFRRTIGLGVALAFLLGGLKISPSHSALVSEFPPKKQILQLDPDADFIHDVGHAGFRGWALDYKSDKPGYALKKLTKPLQLDPGTYRMTFLLRRGHYPKKGLLHKTYRVFRLELWDTTTNELMTERELQKVDFSSPNFYEKRWIEFSMEGRHGHEIEPRVYWFGLANAEIGNIKIDQFPEPSLSSLEEKAHYFGERLEREFIENGYVVSREFDGVAREKGDATTYTGFYIASLAWKYAVTKNPQTYLALENGIKSLHNSIRGTDDHPYLTRYIDEFGDPYPKSASKDVYTSFFFAYSAAYPHIKDTKLKEQMKKDIRHIGDRFLQDGLRVKFPDNEVLSLTPYLTEDEIRHGLNKLFNNPTKHKKILQTLKKSKRLIPVSGFWPALRKVIRGLKKKDTDRMIKLVVPTMNETLKLAVRVRDVLKEQYRQDLFPKRKRNQEYPGKRLEILLTEAMNKFPKKFKRISDAKVLASNALISLHMIQTAKHMTQGTQFKDYYANNLYTQDALLQSALDWYSFEEDITILVEGNPSADRLRKGYLSALSLYNLIQLETNPAVKEKYQLVMDRWWKTYRHENNPMAAALQIASQGKANGFKGLITRALDLYPVNQTGFGSTYWAERGAYIAERLGGGMKRGFSREALPVSHRPKGSFLWQRNARRLRGDYLRNYPATDYLFVYWFCRYHNIIPPTPQQPTVRK